MVKTLYTSSTEWWKHIANLKDKYALPTFYDEKKRKEENRLQI